MSVKTRVTWNLPMDQTTVDQVNTQAQLMASQGKETQPPEYGLENNQSSVYRFWIDMDTANEWLNFVAPYQPASVEILN